MTDQQMLQNTLDEVREIRTLVIDLLQRVAKLETQLDGVVGDQQPGRLTLVEQTVKELQSWRWRMVGLGAGSSAVVTGLGALVFHLMK
jgi:hypothetical protein